MTGKRMEEISEWAAKLAGLMVVIAIVVLSAWGIVAGLRGIVRAFIG